MDLIQIFFPECKSKSMSGCFIHQAGIFGVKCFSIFCGLILADSNVKIGQGQLRLIIKHILFYHICGLQPFWSRDLNNLMNTPSNSPVISEKPMLVCGSPN